MLAIPLMIVTNTVGAIVAFAIGVFIIPVPEFDNELEILAVNAIGITSYLGLALVVGLRWGWHQYSEVTAWLREGRVPDERERRRTLREPLRFVTIHAVMWGIGAVLFGALNLRYSGELARVATITIALSGMVACAVAFLLVLRIGRPVAVRALAAGLPRRPVLPGMTARLVLAWVLGTGVPLVGVLLVAGGALLGRDVSQTQIAVTVLGLGGVAIGVGLALVYFSARAAAAPVLAVHDAVSRVEGGELDVQVPVFDDSELGLLQARFNRMVTGLRERELLRDLFGRHVGEDVARDALDGNVELGGELRDVAVLFVDAIGSTTLAATRPATEVVELLNRFFDVVVDVVTGHGGWINKFEGDAALAIFGAPVNRGDAATGALGAGRELAARLPVEVPELAAAVGVSAGRAVAGNIGAEHRYEYTVIGDPVNEAARLTELAKSTDSRVLASAAALDRATDAEASHWRLGESVHLRGRTTPTQVAEPSHGSTASGADGYRPTS